MNQKKSTEPIMDTITALACAADIEKFLLSKGIYYKVTKEHQPGLKFIRFEMSLKVNS